MTRPAKWPWCAMDSAYELGRALNPRLVEQQLVGGAWMGISHALYETPEPYYPDPSHGPRDFVEYLMPGPGDICPHDIAVLERPAADGPFGAKGRAKCAPTRCCRRWPMRSSTPSACGSMICRSRRKRSCGRSRPRAARGRRRGAEAARMPVRSNIVGIDSPEALEKALRAAYYLADDADCDRVLSRARARQAAVAGRRARRRQDRSRQGDCRRCSAAS